MSPTPQSFNRDTGKSALIPFRLVDKWLLATPLALSTLCVAIITFSNYLTDIFIQGTALIIGTPTDVAALYALIPGSEHNRSGYYTFPCNSDIPDIVFYFSGQAFSITQSFNFGPVSPGSNMCFGSIWGSQDTSFWVLGTSFMTNYYTVFDLGTTQVGFATL